MGTQVAYICTAAHSALGLSGVHQAGIPLSARAADAIRALDAGLGAGVAVEAIFITMQAPSSIEYNFLLLFNCSTKPPNQNLGGFGWGGWGLEMILGVFFFFWYFGQYLAVFGQYLYICIFFFVNQKNIEF